MTSEGEAFYIHRLVFCGQSPVFKSLLESEYWATDNKVAMIYYLHCIMCNRLLYQLSIVKQ